MPVAMAELKAMLEMADMMARMTAGWIDHDSAILPCATPTTVADAMAQSTMATSDASPVHGMISHNDLGCEPDCFASCSVTVVAGLVEAILSSGGYTDSRT